ncbi:MAG: hypothetical protein L0H37_02140 [Nitrosospira sp.]|nr:hypothetical protein [Nitrosospira sp.]
MEKPASRVSGHELSGLHFLGSPWWRDNELSMRIPIGTFSIYCSRSGQYDAGRRILETPNRFNEPARSAYVHITITCNFISALARSRLGGEMIDNMRFRLLQGTFERSPIPDVPEDEAGVVGQAGMAGFFSMDLG